MQVSGLRTTIVNVANNGFGGNALGKEMAKAVKTLSSNEGVKSMDTRHVATAIGSLSPSLNAMINEMRDEGVSAQPTPSSGMGDTDKGI